MQIAVTKNSDDANIVHSDGQALVGYGIDVVKVLECIWTCLNADNVDRGWEEILEDHVLVHASQKQMREAK